MLDFVARWSENLHVCFIIYYIQGGVVELLFDDYNSTWYDRRDRAWYEGEREPLEKRYVFVSRSREEKAGEGLFLKRKVYIRFNFGCQGIVAGGPRELGGLLLWPRETKARGGQ